LAFNPASNNSLVVADIHWLQLKSALMGTQLLIFNDGAALWAARVGTAHFFFTYTRLPFVTSHMEFLKLRAMTAG